MRKTLILHNGEYKKFDTTWQTVSPTLPTKDVFMSDGMDSISPLLDRKVQPLPSLPMTDKKARQFARYFLRGAVSPDVDKQGRILIPAPLREAAALEKDVTMIGVGNRVEIWNPERLDDNSTFDDMDEIAEHMADLGI